VVEVAAVVVVVAAAVVVGGVSDSERRTMTKSTILIFKRLAALIFLPTLVSAGLLSIGGVPSIKAQTTNASRGNGYATAQEAVNALIDAAGKFDTKTLGTILGPQSYDVINSGEPARDREMAMQFANEARMKQSLVAIPKYPGRMILSVGNEDWPFPVPLTKVGGEWYFDTRAGREEVLLRRIGRNELDAIEISRGYVEAQYEYAMQKHGEAGVNQYAQRIIASPGNQDGLAWQNSDGTWGGPIGENVAKAIARGYTSRDEPYHGYFFQVLKGQGPAAAPLGQLDYVVKGVMIGGFALIAAPSQYRITGVKTFMISQDGVVYEKDLGPKTLEIVRGIELFNPDRTWTPVFEER
jgi:hypothetical protein